MQGGPSSPRRQGRSGSRVTGWTSQRCFPRRLAGHLHVVTHVREALEDVFVGMGYEIAEGPEVERAGATSTR